MSEHIVARALRARAEEILRQADGETSPVYKSAMHKSAMQLIATEYVKLADELHFMEQQPVFDVADRMAEQ